MNIIIALTLAATASSAVVAKPVEPTQQTVAPVAEKKVCRMTQKTGTRIGSIRVCTTVKQDKQIAKEQAENAEQFRKEAANPINPNPIR